MNKTYTKVKTEDSNLLTGSYRFEKVNTNVHLIYT